MASVRANPRIAIRKSSSFKDGFREVPKRRAPNTVPIPTPAPANPIVAKPAPISFAAANILIILSICISIKKLLIKIYNLSEKRDLNSQLQTWQVYTLPLSYFRNTRSLN